MNKERNSLPLYTEVQTFSRWWLLVALFPPIIPLLFIINDHSGKSLLLPIIIVILISAILPFLFLGTLKVELRPDTISFKLTPYTLRWHSIMKDDIARIYTRKYDPMEEFGGWGVKWGMSGGRNNMCYTTRGDMGIQIELKDGRKILIGTQKPQEWENLLADYLKTSSTSL